MVNLIVICPTWSFFFLLSLLLILLRKLNVRLFDILNLWSIFIILVQKLAIFLRIQLIIFESGVCFSKICGLIFGILFRLDHCKVDQVFVDFTFNIRQRLLTIIICQTRILFGIQLRFIVAWKNGGFSTSCQEMLRRLLHFWLILMLRIRNLYRIDDISVA